MSASKCHEDWELLMESLMVDLREVVRPDGFGRLVFEVVYWLLLLMLLTRVRQSSRRHCLLPPRMSRASLGGVHH